MVAAQGSGMAIALVMLALAILRAVLNYIYSVAVAVLVERYIVVELRSRVYEKLQRLSFRFYDANETRIDYQPRDRRLPRRGEFRQQRADPEHYHGALAGRLSFVHAGDSREADRRLFGHGARCCG